MKSLVFLLLVVDIILIKGNASDPCHDYSELPRKDYRYHEFKVNDKTYDHDYYLEEGWYRAGDLTIPDTPPPDFNRCGTSVPIWMQGAHPSPEDGIVERTACTISLFDWCAFGYNIKVKNCGTYFVYYLLPTTTRIEGYCFGVDAPHHEHEILDFVPKRPKLIAEPERHYRGRTTYSMVHFKCQFDLPKTNEKYYYRIEWIASDFGKPQRRFNVSKAVQADKLKTLELTEALFSRHKLHMGMNLACRVYVHLRFDVQDGTVSERSESLHLGIHVNVRDTVVQRGKKGRIEFKPTVPIGCPGEGPCRIYVEAFVPKECDVAPEFDTFCGVCLQSDSWNDTYTATFTPHASLEYEKSGIYDVHFKITNAVYGSMWSSYALPPVAITVEKGGDTWKGKKCSSNNDPHMTTFDGRKYELHKPGTYVLYKHKRHDAEVQIKLSPCSGYRPDVQCNCGVAVRAGNEVFVIDKCEDTNAVFGFKSKACNGDAIFPRRISESTYWIVFVYGTYVEVNIGSASSKYINVQVVPSVHDQDSSSTGLCGQLNGNTMDDFVLQSGKISEETRDPTCLSTRWYSCFQNDFTQDWKVSVKKSLFVFGEVLERSLQPWPTYVCVCPEHRKEADLATEICDSTAKCLTGNKVAQTTCNRLKRRKRDIRWHERFPRKARKTERRSLVKREVTYDTWSEESATKFCNEYLNKSPVFGLCGDVPNARPQLSLETCIIDIILQQTTVWSDNSVNMMQGSCINEITRNNTLREEPSKNETQPNLAETIQANTCPGLCSGRGECDNGTCICEPGFGFDDCSLDISEPPEIFGITDDGLCDEREEHCLEAMVHGETFTEIGELICNIRPFLMPHGSSRRSYKASSRVKGQLDTLYEIFCPVNGIEIYDTHVDPLAPRKSSVVGFTISVSNDGVHFGEEVDLYLYDSACLLPTKNTDERYEFVLENNFCLINRRCFADGELCGTDPCLICDMQHNQYNWTERAPEDCIPTTTNPTTTSTASITPSGDDYYEYYDYYAPSEIDPTYIDSESLSTETTSTTKTTSKTPTTITTSSNSTTTATSTTPITTTTTTTPTTASSSTIPTTTTTSTTPTTTITSTTHTTTTTSTTPTTTTPTSTTTSAIPTTTTASTTPTTTTTSTTPTTTITSATPSTTTASTTPTTTTTSTTPTTTITSTTPTTTTTSTTPTTTITSTTRTTSKTSTIPTTTTTNSAPTTSIATPTILITSTIPTTTTRITTSTTTRASSASSTKSTAPATTTKSTASSSTTASKTHSYTTTNSTSTYSTVASTVTARSTVKPQTTILSDDTIIASVSGIVGVLVLCVVSIFLFRLCAKRKKSQAYSIDKDESNEDDKTVQHLPDEFNGHTHEQSNIFDEDI